MLAPVLIAAPAEKPVSRTEAKAHCRVDFDEDDALIDLLIAAATGHLDGWTGILGRALVTQSWRQDFECFLPQDRMRLGLWPVASITSITYFDEADTVQTLAPSAYRLMADDRGAFVFGTQIASMPRTARRPDAVSVTYVAGAAVAEVPPEFKSAILLLVGHWYANREAVNVGNITTELPMAVNALLAPYRRVGL